MARVLLIKTCKEAPPGVGDGCSPPLGLMILASYARKERFGQDEFTLVDERVRRKSDSEWLDFIAELKPDCIGISALTVEYDRLQTLVPLIKCHFPDIPIVLGGPHATSAGPGLMKYLPVDFLVMGEGEMTFAGLLEMVESGLDRPVSELSGLAYRNDEGQIVHWPKNQELIDSKELPFPAWDLIDVYDYQHLPHMTPFHGQKLYAPLVTSRGCPYHCIYCHEIFGKKFRPRTALQVVDEIEHLIRLYGVHNFEIFDDIFNLDKNRVLAICSEIHKRGLKTAFSFPNGVRSDLLDREVLEALASVGTYHVAFAVESASLRIQKLAKKNIDLEKVRENIAIARELGIFCWGFFMLGFPTETRGEIWRTIYWAWNSPLQGAFFFQVIPHAGTALAKEYAEEQSREVSTNLPDYFNAQGSLANVGTMELWITQAMAYLIFLTAPRRLLAIYRHSGRNGASMFGTFGRFVDYLFLQKTRSMAKRLVTLFKV